MSVAVGCTATDFIVGNPTTIDVAGESKSHVGGSLIATAPSNAKTTTIIGTRLACNRVELKKSVRMGKEVVYPDHRPCP
jgi:hypothetical protein